MFEEVTQLRSQMNAPQSGADSADERPAAHVAHSMDQRRLQLLSAAFKGTASASVNKTTTSYGRKPSLLVLTKRNDTGNNNERLDHYSHQVKFHLGHETTSAGSTNQNAGLRGILKGRLHPGDGKDASETLCNEDISLQPLKEDQQEGIATTVRNVDLEEAARQSLLNTLPFHKHTDQSISRIDLQVNAERKWLKEFPQSYAWDSLQDRVLYHRSEGGSDAVHAENELAERFIDTVMLQGAAHVNNLLHGADNDKERLVVRLTFALLDAVVDEAIAELCGEMLKRSAQAWGVLNKSLMKSLASVSLGLEGSSSRYVKSWVCICSAARWRHVECLTVQCVTSPACSCAAIQILEDVRSGVRTERPANRHTAAAYWSGQCHWRWSCSQ
jgi:hypothetical protein